MGQVHGVENPFEHSLQYLVSGYFAGIGLESGSRLQFALQSVFKGTDALQQIQRLLSLPGVFAVTGLLFLGQLLGHLLDFLNRRIQQKITFLPSTEYRLPRNDVSQL